MSDPYTTLGVPHGASPDACKAAFRKLAKLWHPDVNQSNPDEAKIRFQEINEAYDAIVNPKPQPQPQFGHPWHFDLGNIPGMPLGDLGNLFAHLHGGQRYDLTYETQLTLEEAFYGKEIAFQIPDRGSREIKIRIPAGVEDGTRLVVHGAGHQQGPRPGDLYIIIRILLHARFTRHGVNLVTTIPVTAFDVLLGNEIEVVGIDGRTMRIAIPGSYESSRKLRLAGQGMPDTGGSRGDLLVDLFIQYPVVPEPQRDALRAVAAALGQI